MRQKNPTDLHSMLMRTRCPLTVLEKCWTFFREMNIWHMMRSNMGTSPFLRSLYQNCVTSVRFRLDSKPTFRRLLFIAFRAKNLCERANLMEAKGRVANCWDVRVRSFIFQRTLYRQLGMARLINTSTRPRHTYLWSPYMRFVVEELRLKFTNTGNN